MHVVFFNRSYFPDATATGQLLTDLAEGLVRDHGCRVTVVAGPGAGPRREAHNGVEIVRARGTRFSKRRFIGRFTNYVSYFLAACWTGLRLDRPDVVVALTDPPIVGLAAWLAARRHRAPFVMSFRDIFPEVARLLEDFQSDVVEAVLQHVTSFLARHATRSVVLGESMRRVLIESKGAPADRLVIIPDWADCEAIVPAPKRNPFSMMHGLSDRFVVMHSGNIGLSQGLEHLVEAAAWLTDCQDLELVFVGDGVKRQELERLASENRLRNTRFLPFQPKDALVDSFATADVFIVSLKPGLSGFIVPSKLYGILAAGRPYIAAIEEDSEAAIIAREHACGLLAPFGDSVDLADKIRQLYYDRRLSARLGANARRAALRFDRGVLIREYHQLLTHVVDCRTEGIAAPVSAGATLERPNPILPSR